MSSGTDVPVTLRRSTRLTENFIKTNLVNLSIKERIEKELCTKGFLTDIYKITEIPIHLINPVVHLTKVKINNVYKSLSTFNLTDNLKVNYNHETSDQIIVNARFNFNELPTLSDLTFLEIHYGKKIISLPSTRKKLQNVNALSVNAISLMFDNLVTDSTTTIQDLFQGSTIADIKKHNSFASFILEIFRLCICSGSCSLPLSYKNIGGCEIPYFQSNGKPELDLTFKLDRPLDVEYTRMKSNLLQDPGFAYSLFATLFDVKSALTFTQQYESTPKPTKRKITMASSCSNANSTMTLATSGSNTSRTTRTSKRCRRAKEASPVASSVGSNPDITISIPMITATYSDDSCETLVDIADKNNLIFRVSLETKQLLSLFNCLNDVDVIEDLSKLQDIFGPYKHNKFENFHLNYNPLPSLVREELGSLLRCADSFDILADRVGGIRLEGGGVTSSLIDLSNKVKDKSMNKKQKEMLGAYLQKYNFAKLFKEYQKLHTFLNKHRSIKNLKL